MPRLPLLQPPVTARLVTDTFRGYNHSIKIADGEMYDTTNLTADCFPLLASRRPRGVKTVLSDPGGLLEKDALCYVDGGTLYMNDRPTAITNLSAGEKQLVSMGAYVLIFPDKRYFNTENPTDFGYMEADLRLTGEIAYAPCDVDGQVYDISSVSEREPDSPENGAYWLDTAGMTLQQYSAATGTWSEVTTVYTRLTFPSQGQIPAQFKQGDGVEISGAAYKELNGTKYLYALGGKQQTADDFIVLVGLIGAPGKAQGTVRIQRRVPAMDFVIECQNRLWGCFYGNDGSNNINEIYCSALGDFKNWRQYQGLSTDSWAASVGSDGVWTGAVNYLGHPTFFKENRIHTVTVSPIGAHRVEETVCRGVQKGSHKSLAVVGETLYYKSRTDVCAWQGGFPVTVSAALGDTRYSQAAGGAFGSKYYLSMLAEDGKWNLFVYDIARGLWLREDALHAQCFARVDDELWCIERDSKELIALNGTQGTPEEPVIWGMETGLMYYEFPDKKYVSRYNIRLRMVAGASAEILLEYDSSGDWVPSGKVALRGTGTVTVPIRPRRCDHLRMKLRGRGETRILSIARILEVGSDA